MGEMSPGGWEGRVPMHRSHIAKVVGWHTGATSLCPAGKNQW